MILKSYKIEKNSVVASNFFLIYGENSGLKEDITDSILTLKESKEYKKFEFDEDAVIKDINNLYNLIYSGSLFDEKNFIIINRVTDKSLELADDISKKEISDKLIFFRAWKLDKKSKIRNFFEKNKKFACIACYQDSDIDLKKIINNELIKRKIKLSVESINLLIERASGDRKNLRNEMAKLISYAHNKNIVDQ